ncbi:uncharacterized protein [Panulirus ornatus]|uniref:uncharacterized protein n=1 Tax=Panulirus ornatus TaxID=150431 RepID=UPI003A8C16E8
MGWVYWVGGYKVDGHRWRWINEDEINLRSHIWLPSAPTVDNTTANTLLVPANQEHRRFYLSQQLEGRTAPAYVCQIATGLRPFQASSKIHSVSHEVPQDQTPPKT